MTSLPPDEAPKPRDEDDKQESAPIAGDFNVVLGPPPRGSIGSGNVYVRDADARRNVIHNGPESEAYGFGARAGKGSKAFGAFANAGAAPELLDLLRQLVATLQEAEEVEGAGAASELIVQAQSSTPEAGVIRRAWAAAHVAATLNGATALALRVEPLIHSLLNSL